MNESQAFLFFLSVLSFGWIGFAANYIPEKFNGVFVMAFISGNVVMGIFALTNLAILLGKNF